MGNRDDDRNPRNPMRNSGGSDRSARPDERGPRPDRGEPGHAFDHYAHGPNESPYEGDAYPRDRFERGSGFMREDRFGHTPGQRWNGGYGGDRDRYQNGPPSGSNLGGRGFTGSDFQGSRDYAGDRDIGGRDFGGLPRHRDTRYGAPADMTSHYDRDYERALDHERHFGNAVDRAGRMAPTGYGFHGSDMGMGAPEIDRGPHYGKGPKGYKRSDDRTRDDVCDAIAHFGHVDASEVEVKVADGIVTLSGTVGHRRDKRALEHVVERCRGVHDIHNELRVKREDREASASSSKSGEKSGDTKLTSTREDTSRDGLRDGNNGNHKNGKTART